MNILTGLKYAQEKCETISQGQTIAVTLNQIFETVLSSNENNLKNLTLSLTVRLQMLNHMLSTKRLPKNSLQLANSVKT